MTDEKITKRIRKLLALAENNTNIHESASAAASAAKLMAKYNIDRAAVLIKTLDEDGIIARGFTDKKRKTVPKWVSRLAVPVARVHDCEVRLGYGGQLEFLGETEDTEVASWVMSYLIDQVERFSAKYRRDKRKKLGARNGTVMADYRYGLVAEISNTLKEMINAKQQQAVTGRELVVCKQQLIQKKFHVTYSKVKTNFRDINALHDGREHGKTIGINAVVTNNSNPQLN